MQSSLAGLLCRLFSAFILRLFLTANLSRKVSYQVSVFQNLITLVNFLYSRHIPSSVGVFLNGKIISVNELCDLWNPALYVFLRVVGKFPVSFLLYFKGNFVVKEIC